MLISWYELSQEVNPQCFPLMELCPSTPLAVNGCQLAHHEMLQFIIQLVVNVRLCLSVQVYGTPNYINGY